MGEVIATLAALSIIFVLGFAAGRNIKIDVIPGRIVTTDQGSFFVMSLDLPRRTKKTESPNLPFLPEWSYWVVQIAAGFLFYRWGWWRGFLWAAYNSPSSFRGWVNQVTKWGLKDAETLLEKPKHSDVTAGRKAGK